MSPIYEPAAVKVQGTNKIVITTSVASATAPSLATDVNAATAVEATLAMYGQWRPPVTVGTGNAPVRIGTTVQLPQEGNAQLGVIPVTYPHDPSADDTDPNNKLRALLAEGTEVYVIVRKGVDKDTAWAVGDRVDVWHVRAGYQDTDATTDEGEYAEAAVAQNLVPLATKVEGTLVA